MLSSKVVNNTFRYNLNKDLLRKLIVKIELIRIDIQEGVTVKVLLNSRVTDLVISLEFTRKQEFKLKKIEKPIYIRNVNSTFKKKWPIEHILEVNISYKDHRKKTEIDMIEE